MKHLTKIAVLGIAALSVPALNAMAQEDPVMEMDSVDCRTMLKMDSNEQDFTIIYFHGFISGARGETLFNGPVLREATNKVMDYCIDNPSAKVMEAFEKNR